MAYPSLTAICTGIIGAAFFLFLAYLSFIELERNKNSSQGNDIWTWIALIGFISMSLASFYLLLTIKKVSLTNKDLTISYPLVFYKKIIELTTIKKVIEDNYKHTTMLLDGSTYTRYNGKRLILQLSSNKKITITSWEITNYLELAKNSKILFGNRFKSKVKNKSSINI